MAARILSTLAYWALMSVLIPGALVIVLCLYFPYVGLKAAWLGVTGRIDEARGGSKAARAASKGAPAGRASA